VLLCIEEDPSVLGIITECAENCDSGVESHLKYRENQG